MARRVLIWAGAGLVVLIAVVASALSPLLAWREPVYIAAGFAGVLGMGLLLIQPMLVASNPPGISVHRARRLHRITGMLLIGSIIVHVGGLWITSPPDVIDALTFTSPAPFAPWGVAAMWAAVLAAGVAMYHARFRPRHFRFIHYALATLVIVGTIVHALLIDGTMEPVSKAVLSGLLVVAALRAGLRLKVWRGMQRGS